MSTQLVPPPSTIPPVVTDEQIELIERKRSGLLTRAMELVIDCPAAKQIAWDIINGIADLKKAIVEDFKESKSAAAKAHKAICAQENAHLEELVQPDKIVREKLSVYEAECRRIQAEAEAAARKAAEEEQKRLQAIADEQARLAQEQARKDAEEKQIADALAAEAAGKPEVAAAILEAAPVVVPTFVAPVVSVAPVVVPAMSQVKVEGQGSMVEKWFFEITDASIIPDEYKVINENAIGKVVDALKGATKIPGVKPYSKWVPRTSGRRS